MIHDGQTLALEKALDRTGMAEADKRSWVRLLKHVSLSENQDGFEECVATLEEAGVDRSWLDAEDLPPTPAWVEDLTGGRGDPDSGRSEPAVSDLAAPPGSEPALTGRERSLAALAAHRFQKGVSGNPKGKPKGTGFAGLIAAVPKTQKAKIIKVAIAQAMQGNHNARDWLSKNCPSFMDETVETTSFSINFQTSRPVGEDDDEE